MCDFLAVLNDFDRCVSCWVLPYGTQLPWGFCPIIPLTFFSKTPVTRILLILVVYSQWLCWLAGFIYNWIFKLKQHKWNVEILHRAHHIFDGFSQQVGKLKSFWNTSSWFLENHCLLIFLLLLASPQNSIHFLFVCLSLGVGVIRP